MHSALCTLSSSLIARCRSLCQRGYHIAPSLNAAAGCLGRLVRGGGAAGRKSRRSTLVTETLSQQFKEQLESLMGSISVTNPRCETAQSDSSRGLRGSSLAVSSSSIPLCITPLISQLDAISPVVGSFRGRTLHSYVRCLKPNDSNCADLLEPRRLVEQLRYCGVLEVLQYIMNCEHAA